MTDARSPDLALLQGRLLDLFGLNNVSDFSRMPSGYKCQNFRFSSGTEVFFLKQYRGRISHWVAEIKFAERFFSDAGLPVVRPMTDRFHRPMFFFEGEWWSLFPFISDVVPARGNISDRTIRSLGATLGAFHLAGEAVVNDQFQRLHVWDPTAFFMEVVELEEAIERRTDLSSELRGRLRETLARKRTFVERNTLKRFDIPLADSCFLHGDFIPQNVFIDASGDVSGVFDFEKTTKGPRAYELARSLLITCFDDGWTPKHLARARQFLRAYQERFPITEAEFAEGVRMYMTHVAHMTWIEARILLKDGGEEHVGLFDAHARRIEHIGEDPQAFCDAVY